MKIIFDRRDRETVFEHAQKVIKAQEEWLYKHRPGQINPRGVAVHMTLHPIKCDDCGETYWSRDEYGSHISCKGPRPKQAAGFGG